MKTGVKAIVLLSLSLAIGNNLFAQDNFHVENKEARIEPNWESMIEKYNAPEWFRDGKIGIWSHWGPGSVENRPEGLSARERIDLWKAEKWDPDALVKFFKENGASFIMPVGSHHGNFDRYDSFHPWNSVDMGPKRDILGDWKAAAVKHGLKFGVSSHLYWSPNYLKDARDPKYKGTPEWILYNMDYSPSGYRTQDSWNEHWTARCWEIIEKYDPDMFNNDSPYPDEKQEHSGVKLFSSYVNRDLEENGGEQTVVLSFKDMNRNKAAFTYNLERGMFGELQPYPWMWATDLSGSWNYRKGAEPRMSIPVLIGNAVDVISKNGVVMMNIALRGDGTLPENQAAMLKALGDWLKINGEGIYGTRPWITYGEGPTEIITSRIGENLEDYSPKDIRFTTKGDVIYAFVLARPTGDIFIRKLCQKGLYTGTVAAITMLGSDEKLVWEHSRRGLLIKMPEKLPDQPVIGFKISSR